MARVVVVGGGVAGLRCAGVLSEAGVDVVVMERDDRVGGRVRTDRHEGYLLDRGFQVLPTSYSEARSALDFGALDLHEFRSGALVRRGGEFRALHHPLRHPGQLFETLRGVPGTVGDRVRLAVWVVELLLRGEEAALGGDDRSSRERLLRRGFSEEIVDGLFRPFFGGVFLESDLRTAGSMLAFVLRTFAAGPAALPADGMEAIPRQLADALPDGTVRTGSRVTGLVPGGRGVRLEGGATETADAVVVATDPWTAADLIPTLDEPGRRSVTGLYFGADRAPVEDPLLVLNGEPEGPVNHLSVPSRVCPRYAPPGRELVSVTVLDDPPADDRELQAAVRRQLRDWFGGQVDRWRLLRVDRIRSALPAAPAGTIQGESSSPRVAPHLYVCGDHREHPSLEGALVSGRRAAQAVVRDRQESAATAAHPDGGHGGGRRHRA